MIKSLKRVLPLISLLFINLGVCYAQPKSPLQLVNLFDKCYGSPCMDEIADYTTPEFRDKKPKSVWVVDTWKTLKEIDYARLNSSVVEQKVKADKAIVIIEATIKTAAGQVTQKEIYYLIKQGGKWLIDELVVTDEEIDPEQLRL
jgi:hypothetical protein